MRGIYVHAVVARRICYNWVHLMCVRVLRIYRIRVLRSASIHNAKNAIKDVMKRLTYKIGVSQPYDILRTRGCPCLPDMRDSSGGQTTRLQDTRYRYKMSPRKRVSVLRVPREAYSPVARLVEVVRKHVRASGRALRRVTMIQY